MLLFIVIFHVVLAVQVSSLLYNFSVRFNALLTCLFAMHPIQRVEKGCIGNKWVNHRDVSPNALFGKFYRVFQRITRDVLRTLLNIKGGTFCKNSCDWNPLSILAKNLNGRYLVRFSNTLLTTVIESDLYISHLKYSNKELFL